VIKIEELKKEWDGYYDQYGNWYPKHLFGEEW